MELEATENAALFTTSLQGLLGELSSCEDGEEMSLLADKAIQQLQHLHSSPSIVCSSSSITQLHGCGVSLWNRVVTLKSANTLSLSLNAKLRQVACSVVLLFTPSQCSQQGLKRQITMAIKTSRAWLDAENAVMAETTLGLAHQCWVKLSKDHPSICQQQDCVKLLFRILCCKAEAYVALNQVQEGLGAAQEARKILSDLNKEQASYLSMLCYNSGLDLFQRGKYEYAVDWLKESYDIGQATQNVGAVKQSRTLRLLANSLLEWDGPAMWQRALNAVGLANSEHSHPSGLLLKTRIFLQYMPNSERLASALDDALTHPDVSVEMVSAAIRIASQYNRHDLAVNGITLLKQKYKHSPDLLSIHLLHLSLILEKGATVDAKDLVEECITAHVRGDNFSTGNAALNQLHYILWEQAAKAFELSNWTDALQWYSYSLALFPDHCSGDKNVAKLQRNRCACYLALEQYDKATEAVQSALQQEPDSPHTHFLSFKVAVLLGEKENAIRALQAMVTGDQCVGDLPGLLSLAAQLAFEHNRKELAVETLQHVSQNSVSSQQALTSLRCLVRLKLTELNDASTDKQLSTLQRVLGCVEEAEQYVSQLAGEEKVTESVWFMKVSWNTALQSGNNYNEMRRAFQACYRLCSILPNDHTNISRQKTCQLMSAAACLQAARTSEQEKSDLIEQVLSHVNKCRDLCRLLPSFSSDPSLPLLLLYELEAQLTLHSIEAGHVMERVNQIDNVEPKIYETIAALVLQAATHSTTSGVNHKRLAQAALQKAVELHSHVTSPDGERLARCYHSLIMLHIGGETATDMASTEEAWTVLSEVLRVIENGTKFPEMELVWLLVKVWNTGIHLYSSSQHRKAERWCSLAMKILAHLPAHLSPSYQDQMSSVYDEVLAHVDQPGMDQY